MRAMSVAQPSLGCRAPPHHAPVDASHSLVRAPVHRALPAHLTSTATNSLCSTSSQSCIRRRRQTVASAAFQGSVEGQFVVKNNVEACNMLSHLKETEKLKNSLGEPLTADESKSLLKCLEVSGGAHGLDVESCVLEGFDALRAHVTMFIEEAQASHASDMELLEGALLLLEQLALQAENTGTWSDPTGAPALRGRWQMIFTSGEAWPRLQYVPVPEFMEVEPDGTHFHVDSKLGPFYTSFTGVCKWLTPNRLEYTVDHLQLDLWRLGGVNVPVPFPDNELCIYAVNDQVACARSRRGGIILFAKPY